MIEYTKHLDSVFQGHWLKTAKKYTKIWERVSSLINIKFYSEPVYCDNDKYIKTKIKSYRDKINTNFQDKKIPKEDASYKCL